MKEIIEFLKQNKFGNLATCNNEKPDTRPFELVFYCDKGMFFYASADDLVNQLNINHNICFCATDEHYNYVKISGSIKFSEDSDDKTKILENSVFAKKVFKDRDLNKMKVFYLPSGKCLMHFHRDNKVITDEF